MSIEELEELMDFLTIQSMYSPDPSIYEKAKEVRSRIRELEK